MRGLRKVSALNMILKSSTYFIEGGGVWVLLLLEGGGVVPVFLRKHNIQLKAGHHRSASETPLKWRFADGPMMDQYCDFLGGSGP